MATERMEVAWTPASRPPDDGRDVLVVIDPGGEIAVGHYSPRSKTWFADGEALDRGWSVTHWWELPAPPRT